MHSAPHKRLHRAFDRSRAAALGDFSRNSLYYIVYFYAALVNCRLKPRIPANQANRKVGG